MSSSFVPRGIELYNNTQINEFIIERMWTSLFPMMGYTNHYERKRQKSFCEDTANPPTGLRN